MGKVFDQIVTIDNALNAFKIIRRGHSENYSMLNFENNLMSNIAKILISIKNGTYKVRGYRTLVVREPKERNIYAPYVEDRLVQQMIYTVIEPYLDKKMDMHSCACRTGKGVEYARKLCQRSMREKKSIWYVKLDIDKYFASIDHEILRNIISKHIKDKEVLNLVDKFIGNGFGESGIPIGNLLSQLFANVYLNELDLFVRHKTTALKYVRYMDDFICFTETKAEATVIKKQIFKFVNNELKLNIDNRKVKIQKVKYGITFLGHKIKPRKCYLSRTKTKKLRKNIKRYIKSKMSIDLHHTFVNLIPKEDYGFLNSVIKIYNNIKFGIATKLIILKAFCKKFNISLMGNKFIIKGKR